MHLKSLTLKGFKSFASATTLRFEPGITCVVGPNGSGKSNVVDALTWVMGEQGAKALRGGKMEDVIFAGTTGRAPLGRAEVTLTIDNSDGAIPIDYTEVSVTRRMFRDGAGEYEINGESCRLMDVQELLSDTGIGREMHVIVGQGRLASILESRPEERRAFIEEAAGVLKHRKRKEKAVRKLDSMQANLSRLTDLTTELRRQLKPLGRQAEVARRAQQVQADLRDSRLRLAADDVVNRKGELAAKSASEEEVRHRQNQAAGELEVVTAQLATSETELATLEPIAQQASQTWYRLAALQERIGATTRVAAERTRFFSEPLVMESRRDPADLEAQADVAAAAEAELELAHIAAKTDLATRAERLTQCEEAAKHAEREHLAAVQAISEGREQRARLEGQLQNLVTKIESNDADVTRLTETIDAVKATGVTAATELVDVHTAVAELEAAEKRLDERNEHALVAELAANDRVDELKIAERENVKTVASLQARIDALGMGLDRGDGGQWLIDNAEGLTDNAKVGQALAKILTVRDGYETAIAVALGPAVDALTAANSTVAQSFIDTLKEHNGGRAALLISNVEQLAYSRFALLAGSEWALDVISYPAEFAGALTSLLANVVIAQDVSAAIEVIAMIPEVRVVTLKGEYLGNGWMFGGSEARPSTLEIQAAIELATTELAKAQHTAEEISASLEGALTEQTTRRAHAEQTLAALHESDTQLSAVYEQLARLGQEQRSAEHEAKRLVSQRNFTESRRVDLLAERAEIEIKLTAAQTYAGASEADLPTQSRDDALAALGLARAGETDGRLTLRTAEERLAAVRGKAESLRRAAAAERAAQERAEAQNLSRRQAASVTSVVAQLGTELSQQLSIAVHDADELRTEIDERKKVVVAEVEQVRRQVAEHAKVVDQLKDAMHRDELARADALSRMEQLAEQILDTYAMTLDDLIAEYGPENPLPPTELEIAEYEAAKERGEIVVAPQPMPFNRAAQEARAKQAQKDLNTLGKVNPLALEEFSALEERYNFLSTQLEDVKSARKDLLSVVAEVDNRILTVFTEAYADVEREFAEVFKVLFPGGEGRLVLTEPGDMLTTGIEVEARPPGKKVKRLSLLSGGEKSLTAIAMLVAIFRARPSPFYVMDEVEAALDDVNLRRLISLFELLRDKSQLIVITHQKPTMEIADALYGVSMRGDGITQVISQRLRGQDVVGRA